MSKSKNTSCCHIMSFDLFNVNFWLVHYALLFLPNPNICVLDSELPCKWNIESRKLLLTLFFHEQERSSLRRFSTHYFLIRFAQTKITLFIFWNNWVIKENESFLLVEPCSRVTCCVEIKLQYFFRKYIFICTIYALLMQLISAILYDTC